MYALVGRGEVHQEDHPQHGRRDAPGYVAGLTPITPFHDPNALPWCAELKRHWKQIRTELRSRLDADDGLWKAGAYEASNAAYGPDWKIIEVFTEDRWKDEDKWKTTRGVISRLPGVKPFEVFFARMTPRSTIAAHSDNLNYILTSHLSLELEPGKSSITVGNSERQWVEGEMLVFDTSYIHSCKNDSDRNR